MRILFFSSLMVGLVSLTSLRADTLEERVTRLEKEVAELKAAKTPNSFYAPKHTRTYVVSNECSKIVWDESETSESTIWPFQMVKEKPCGDKTYVIGRRTDVGVVWLTAFVKSDVVFQER